MNALAAESDNSINAGAGAGQAASVAELHAQSQRYCAQLQEYNSNLQRDVQAAAAQLQTTAAQLQRLQARRECTQGRPRRLDSARRARA
jgi:hypothetical protein